MTETQLRQCEPCLSVMGDGDWWSCDHTDNEVELAMALARWSTDDPEVERDELLQRAAAFLDDGQGDDVRDIMKHLPPAAEFVVESRPFPEGDIETAFAVNGVEFVVEYQAEGPGRVELASAYRPECDDCGERVQNADDTLCALCMADTDA